MKALQFNVMEFVVQWSEASKAGLTMCEMAEMFGYTYATVRLRKSRLAGRGVRLPALKHGLVGKPSNSRGKPKSLATRKQVVRMPDGRQPATYYIGLSAPAFTITTGGEA